MILEDCGAPVTDKDCEYDINGHITKSCGLVDGAVCGQYKQTVKDKVTRPAYEGGSCEAGTGESEVSCTINDAPSVDCCAEVATGKWTAVTGDEGCFLIDGLWKRKHTRTGHDSCAQKNVDFIKDLECQRKADEEAAEKKREAEAKAKAEAERKAKEAEEQARAEAEAKAKAEAEAKQREEEAKQREADEEAARVANLSAHMNQGGSSGGGGLPKKGGPGGSSAGH